MTIESALCPCCSGKNYTDCCEPYIEGKLEAPTAEALLRSRYSAYVLGKVQYILDTVHPDEQPKYNIKGIEKWSKNSDWISLEVLSTQNGTESDTEGTVEFIAEYKEELIQKRHHEKSLFKKSNGIWKFFNGEVVPQKTIKREAPRVGRNDPCICGSGKKYKKCCGK